VPQVGSARGVRQRGRTYFNDCPHIFTVNIKFDFAYYNIERVEKAREKRANKKKPVYQSGLYGQFSKTFLFFQAY
jgi:hypothetical protein